MQRVFHGNESRGYARHGWLETYHSFSFAGYYDPKKMGFGALRVINDDSIAPNQGFGSHPHSNMEIITIPLSGALSHEDSMGNAATIETGEVQVMSAGTGVEHSEFNASISETCDLLQIWILPNKKGVKPQYAQKKIDFPRETHGFVRVVGQYGEKGAGELGIHQNAVLSLGRFESNEEIEYALSDEKNGVYFFVIEGEIVIAGAALQKRDALGVWDTEKVSIQVTKDAFVLGVEVPMLQIF